VVSRKPRASSDTLSEVGVFIETVSMRKPSSLRSKISRYINVQVNVGIAGATYRIFRGIFLIPFCVDGAIMAEEKLRVVVNECSHYVKNECLFYAKQCR